MPQNSTAVALRVERFARYQQRLPVPTPAQSLPRTTALWLQAENGRVRVHAAERQHKSPYYSHQGGTR